VKKLIVSLIALGGLCLSAGAAFAQGDGSGANGPSYGPIPGTPEYYGNSGGRMPGYYGEGAYGPYGPHVPYVQRDLRRAYPSERQHERRRRERDRDGDGISNRYDRYPDDPRRY
jgi:hypothetical protein